MLFKKSKANACSWLADFYDRVGYGGEVCGSDEVFFVEINGKIIGVVRIETEHNILVLRGMQVLSSYQNEGVGTKLLHYLDSNINDDPMYCIPHSWLEKQTIPDTQYSENASTHEQKSSKSTPAFLTMPSTVRFKINCVENWQNGEF